MRKLFALIALSAIVLAVTPTADVLAAGSPVAEPVTDAPGDGGDEEEEPTNPGSSGGNEEGGNSGDKSPQTGNTLAFAYIALIGAAGVSLIAKKKLTE